MCSHAVFSAFDTLLPHAFSAVEIALTDSSAVLPQNLNVISHPPVNRFAQLCSLILQKVLIGSHLWTGDSRNRIGDTQPLLMAHLGPESINVSFFVTPSVKVRITEFKSA